MHKTSTLIQQIKDTLKTLPSHVLVATIGLIVLGLIGGPILFFCEKLRLYIKTLLMSPTPLWLTIVLCMGLLLYLYIRIKNNPLRKSSTKIEYFDVGKYKWKTELYGDNFFKLDETPLCQEHDCLFVRDPYSLYCPVDNCTNNIRNNDIFDIRQKAESDIDNKIRNKKC